MFFSTPRVRKTRGTNIYINTLGSKLCWIMFIKSGKLQERIVGLLGNSWKAWKTREKHNSHTLGKTETNTSTKTKITSETNTQTTSQTKSSRSTELKKMIACLPKVAIPRRCEHLQVQRLEVNEFRSISTCECHAPLGHRGLCVQTAVGLTSSVQPMY